ncbi:MAG TPA: DUF502 domain-containing protein [Pseudomonadales bacterium]|jgi:uncharacterized membrane protein
MKAFLRKAVAGGLLVLLPLFILMLFAWWVLGTLMGFLSPLALWVAQELGLMPWVGYGLVVVGVIMVCFIVGSLVMTRLGAWLHAQFDDRMQKVAPGYRMVREIVQQLFGDSKQSPFAQGKVVRVWPSGRGQGVSLTGIVTSWHDDGGATVFLPTGPNPTTGLILHMPADHFDVLPNVPVDSAFRTIIACGAGSAQLLSVVASGSVQKDSAAS